MPKDLIISLSKALMCEFHWDYIKNKYDNIDGYYLWIPAFYPSISLPHIRGKNSIFDWVSKLNLIWQTYFSFMYVNKIKLYERQFKLIHYWVILYPHTTEYRAFLYAAQLLQSKKKYCKCIFQQPVDLKVKIFLN